MGDHAPADSVLLAEIGPDGLGIALMEARHRTIYRFAYASGENREGALLSSLVKASADWEGPFTQVAIAYRFPQCVLVPSALYRFQDENLYLQSAGAIYPGQVLKSDHLPMWGLQTVYGLPRTLNLTVTRQYLRHQYWHQASVAMKTHDLDKGVLIEIDFRPGDFTLGVHESGKPVLYNQRTYTDPTDVLYHLVQLTQSKGWNREELTLRVSGFVETGSALYRELYLYFGKVLFGSLQMPVHLSNDFADLPEHYFSSLSKLAACVSFPEH